MKKKILVFAAIMFLAVLMPANDCFSGIFGKSHIEKAKEFIAADMYDKAEVILREEIEGSNTHEANPTNAEAHFLLGKIYGLQGKIKDAEARFNSAKKLNPEYGEKIGNELLATAREKKNKGKDYVLASKLYDGAAHYNPGLKKEISPEKFKLGVIFAGLGDADNARNNFESAEKLDPKLSPKITLEYKKAADIHLKNNNLNAATSLYELALARDMGLAKDVAKKLFDYGEEKNHKYLINTAVKLDPGLKAKVKNNCWTKTEKLSGQELLSLNWDAGECGELNESQKEAIGKKLLEEGNRQSSDDERGIYYKEAKKYVDEEMVFEALISYYTKKIGPLEKVELNYANPKVKIPEEIKAGDKIHYLSLNDFWSENEKELRIWPASKTGDFWALFMKSDMVGDSTPVWFKINKKPTTIYYWIEKN